MSKTHWNGLRASAGGLTVLSLVLMSGCEAGKKAFQDPKDLKTHDLFRDIDPTGAIAETEARKQYWEASKKKVDALDVEGFNRAVAELTGVVQQFSQRMESVTAEDIQTIKQDLAASAASIRSQIEKLGLEETASSLRHVSETLKVKADDLDLQPVEDVMRETHALVVQVQGIVDGWDCQVRAGLEDAHAVITHADERVQTLPISELRDALVGLQGSLSVIRESAGGIPETNRTLDETLSAVRWTAYAAIGVLALVGGRILFGAARGRPKSTPAETGEKR